MNKRIRPVLKDFGEPTEQLVTPEGLIQFWWSEPFTITRTVGYISREMGEAMDTFFKELFSRVLFVVTIHDWAELSDYDPVCRRIVQQLAHFMRPKQREIYIHLGPATNIAQLAVRVTAETISKFKRMPIEIFSRDETFEAAVQDLKNKYRL